MKPLLFILLSFFNATVAENLVSCDFEDHFCGWRNGELGQFLDGFLCGIYKGSCHTTSYHVIEWSRVEFSNCEQDSYHKGGMALWSSNNNLIWAAGVTIFSDLISPTFQVSSQEKCVSFSFRLKDNATLNVLLKEERKSEIVIIQSYAYNYNLTRASVNLPIGKAFQIIFRAIYIDSAIGEVLIDDILQYDGTCLDMCPPTQYQCKDKHCIDLGGVCDDAKDCPDGSDEWDCGSLHEKEALFETCLEEFRGIPKGNIVFDICSSNQTKHITPGSKLHCYNTGLRRLSKNISTVGCDTITNTFTNENFCYIYCPFSCTCVGLSFKCKTADVPTLARSIDLSGVTLNITYIEFGLFYHLVVLNLSGCGLQEFRLTKFPRKLQHLDLSHNMVKTLSILLEMPLISLVLDDNPLQKSYVMEPYNHKPVSIIYLQARNVSFNKIEYLRAGQMKAHLDFSFNNLSDFPVLLCEVESALLNLSYNIITRYFPYCKSRMIDVRCNQFDTFVVDPDTEFIFLQNNSLSSFVIPNTYMSSEIKPFKLKYLNVARNNIEYIDPMALREFRYLTYLIICNNLISEIDDETFLNLKMLVYLDLSRNKLIKLTAKALLGLKNLKNLILHSNALKYLEFGIFSCLTELITLDLSQNGLQFVRKGSFDGLAKLQYLFLQHNAFLVSEDIFDGLSTLVYLEVSSYTICCAKPITVAEEKCVSPIDSISSCDQLIDVPILSVCIWYISLLAIFGNIMVIIYRIRFTTTSRSKTQSVFIINLACSDFLMGIYLYIIAITDILYKGKYGLNDYVWRHGKVCTLAGILATTSSETSALFLLLITIDRVISIHQSNRRKKISLKVAVILSIMSWLLSITIALFPLLEVEYFDSFYSTSGICISLPLSTIRKAGWGYAISVFVFFNFLIFMGILIGHVLIFVKVKKTGLHISSTQTQRREVALAKTLLAVVISDMLCWIPICIFGMLTLFGIAMSPKVYAWTVVVILPLNSALNPMIYTLSAVLRERTSGSKKSDFIRISKLCSENEDLKRKISMYEEREIRMESLRGTQEKRNSSMGHASDVTDA